MEEKGEYCSQKIVAIILARGGSKGLPKKNILTLAGKPLIYYTINAAKQSRFVQRIVVSTDDPETAALAKKFGAEVPFMRPGHLSNDDATAEDALAHAFHWMRDNEDFDADIVVYLQITDPFRKASMIDDCVKVLLNNPNIDSAFMGHLEHKNYWQNVDGNFRRLAADIPYGVPRQKREPLYREDTGTALATRGYLISEGKRLGLNCHIIPYEQTVNFIDIHEEFDLWLAEKIIKERGILPFDEEN